MSEASREDLEPLPIYSNIMPKPDVGIRVTNENKMKAYTMGKFGNEPKGKLTKTKRNASTDTIKSAHTLNSPAVVP